MADDQGTERGDAEAAEERSAPLTEAAGTPPDAEATPAQARPDADPTSADTAATRAEDAEADLPPATPARAEAEPAPAAKAAAKADAEPATDGKAAAAVPPARRRASRLWWALPILMLVEFYVYGHDGRLEICVGKEGDTDFSLVGQERTDANRWKFPRCETRENLGLRSQQEERVKEGLEAACRGATIFRHQGQAKACIAGEQGWQHRVQGRFVPPWDPAYYRHLFWFLQ